MKTKDLGEQAYLLNRVSDGQKSMILQQCRLLLAQVLCNILPFLLSQYNTIEAVVHYMIVVESTRILGEGV